jgi:hypothetical protein
MNRGQVAILMHTYTMIVLSHTHSRILYYIHTHVYWQVREVLEQQESQASAAADGLLDGAISQLQAFTHSSIEELTAMLHAAWMRTALSKYCEQVRSGVICRAMGSVVVESLHAHIHTHIHTHICIYAPPGLVVGTCVGRR